MNGKEFKMIYFADDSGRYSHSRDDLTMQTYNELGFTPSHVTDIPPLSPKDGFNVVFNGRAWEYFEIEVPSEQTAAGLPDQ